MIYQVCPAPASNGHVAKLITYFEEQCNTVTSPIDDNIVATTSVDTSFATGSFTINSPLATYPMIDNCITNSIHDAGSYVVVNAPVHSSVIGSPVATYSIDTFSASGSFASNYHLAYSSYIATKSLTVPVCSTDSYVVSSYIVNHPVANNSPDELPLGFSIFLKCPKELLEQTRTKLCKTRNLIKGFDIQASRVCQIAGNFLHLSWLPAINKQRLDFFGPGMTLKC